MMPSLMEDSHTLLPPLPLIPPIASVRSADLPQEQIELQLEEADTKENDKDVGPNEPPRDATDKETNDADTPDNEKKGANNPADEVNENNIANNSADEVNETAKNNIVGAKRKPDVRADESAENAAERETSNEAAADAKPDPPTKKRRGRPPGTQSYKRKGSITIDDPGTLTTSTMLSSPKYVKYLKTKKKIPELAGAYANLHVARDERDAAAKKVKEKKEEVKRIEAALEAARRELEEGEGRLAREEDSFKSAYDDVVEMELKRPNAWNDAYNRLVAYKEMHGHINLPTRCYDDKEFDHLCCWVSRQKRQYQQYKYGELPVERPWRISALEKLGIEWEVKSGLWDKSYKELIAYKAQYGNCMVPTRTSLEYKDLGLWVTVQRDEYRKRTQGRPTPMTQERIDLLDKIGFVWNVQNFQWDEMYQRLVHFRSQEGHCNVPSQHPADQSLASWVARQRKEYEKYCDESVDHQRDSLGRMRSMRMTEERMVLLNAIGFEW